jgi:hypothetical protein
MDPEQFAARVKEVVFDSAVNSVMQALERPAGRRPPTALQRASAWFNELDADDRAYVRFAVRDAAHAAVFGMLCVLDGVRSFDDAKGSLELHYVAPDGSTIKLNPHDDDLHDIFNALVHPVHEPVD